eukprot:3352994-Prorocentrum_lima.AAC.1
MGADMDADVMGFELAEEGRATSRLMESWSREESTRGAADSSEVDGVVVDTWRLNHVETTS